MSLQLEDIEKLASLSRLSLTEEEKQQYLKDFSSILGYVSEISAVDTSSIEETQSLTNVMRDDVVTHESAQFTAKLLAEAPQKEGEYFKVTQVL